MLRFVQVTAKEIRRLEGPSRPLPMDLLEIDAFSGLVVGMNGYVNNHAAGKQEVSVDSQGSPRPSL